MSGIPTHLLNPYASGKALVMAPTSVMVRPKAGSKSITGAQYVSDPRVKY